MLYDGTLCSFVIMPRPRSESSATTAPIVGLATCFNVFPHDGHAEFALARLTNGPSRVFFEGAMLFVNYLFECWPFRKLYVEVAEYNLSQMEFMLGEVGMVEGRLLNYFWANGQHWDKVIVSIERGRWETFSESHPVPND
ncbi:MAG: hypothetical protein R2754_02900 [Microthrixaceae bacterium]